MIKSERTRKAIMSTTHFVVMYALTSAVIKFADRSLKK